MFHVLISYQDTEPWILKPHQVLDNIEDPVEHEIPVSRNSQTNQ